MRLRPVRVRHRVLRGADRRLAGKVQRAADARRHRALHLHQQGGLHHPRHDRREALRTPAQEGGPVARHLHGGARVLARG